MEDQAGEEYARKTKAREDLSKYKMGCQEIDKQLMKLRE
jgi:hypothetical protein